MKYPKIPLAQSVIEICKAKGLKHIVISPGSRNAPLTIGFANNPFFKCYSIADERCAAFFAMGIAQQTKEAVAVVCTSGSALLNYYPAVAEAFYSQIPLVVISADRPCDKIDIGDGQTIRQENVFLNHSLFNANLTEEANPENDLKINTAIDFALAKKGPVHINAPFEEPLYQTVDQLSVEVTVTNHSFETKSISENEISDLAKTWNTSVKKLILVGTNDPDTIDSQIIHKLGNDNSVVVMVETTSNLSHPNFIANIDTIITPFSEEDFNNFQPDLLVTFGGMIVSKRIKAFLRKYQPKQHWHIDTLRAYDTFGCLTHHIETTPNDFFTRFFPLTTGIESNYQSELLEIKKLREEKHQIYLDKIPFSDLKVFEKITDPDASGLPQNIQLQLSNSSTIRYAQLCKIDSSIEIFCNRGTSGIDGSTSTAIGAAVGNTKPTVLITGDISFFYDSNALWNNYIPSNFKIILINNSGGGIFRILPGHEETPVFNTFFETSHSLTAAELSKMYGLNYLTANDISGLDKNLKLLFSQNERPSILEIFTPEKENDKILSQYFKELK
ncbi:MAG: 2-succinyl-5-enolpyruvyl-6-hydroxy-3-cyclohexene-1-carboxylic-acid synthase [Flavobacterium sp.]